MKLLNLVQERHLRPQGRLRFLLGGDDFFATGKAIHSLKNVDDALTTGIDDPRLAEDVEQVRSRCQSLPRSTSGFRQDGRKRRRLGGTRLSTLGSDADHREHRPLDGAHHRLVGHLTGAGERRGQVSTVDLLAIGHRPRKSSEDLGQDDPRVATCAHQGAVRNLGRHLPGTGLDLRGYAGRFAQGCPHGQPHVRSGIPVWNGKDVEGVDPVRVRRQPLRGRADGGEERLTVPDRGWSGNG